MYTAFGIKPQNIISACGCSIRKMSYYIENNSIIYTVEIAFVIASDFVKCLFDNSQYLMLVLLLRVVRLLLLLLLLMMLEKGQRFPFGEWMCVGMCTGMYLLNTQKKKPIATNQILLLLFFFFFNLNTFYLIFQ